MAALDGYLSRVHMAFIADILRQVNVGVRLPGFISRFAAADLG